MHHSLSYLAKTSYQNVFFFLVKFLTNVPLYFCTGNEFLDFCVGACYYDVTKTKPCVCWYFIFVSMFREDSKLTIGTKINIIQ